MALSLSSCLLCDNKPTSFIKNVTVENVQVCEESSDAIKDFNSEDKNQIMKYNMFLEICDIFEIPLGPASKVLHKYKFRERSPFCSVCCDKVKELLDRNIEKERLQAEMLELQIAICKKARRLAKTMKELDRFMHKLEAQVCNLLKVPSIHQRSQGVEKTLSLFRTLVVTSGFRRIRTNNVDSFPVPTINDLETETDALSKNGEELHLLSTKTKNNILTPVSEPMLIINGSGEEWTNFGISLKEESSCNNNYFEQDTLNYSDVADPLGNNEVNHGLEDEILDYSHPKEKQLRYDGNPAYLCMGEGEEVTVSNDNSGLLCGTERNYVSEDIVSKNDNVASLHYIEKLEESSGKFSYKGIEVSIRKGNVYQCGVCGETKTPRNKGKSYVMVANRRIREHIQEMHLGGYKCNLCPTNRDQVYKTLKIYLTHIRRIHKRGIQKCKICEKPYKSSSQLKNHEWLHKSDAEKRDAILLGAYAPKKRSEKINANHECNECGKRFPSKSKLIAHLDTHSKQQITKVPCSICGKVLSQKSIRFHYKFIHQKASAQKYPCSVCNKKFISSTILRTHQNRVHTGEKHMKSVNT